MWNFSRATSVPVSKVINMMLRHIYSEYTAIRVHDLRELKVFSLTGSVGCA